MEHSSSISPSDVTITLGLIFSADLSSRLLQGVENEIRI